MSDSNRIFDLITPFLTEVQNIEYVLDDIRKKRWLKTLINDAWVVTAEGEQLDRIGDIVEQARNLQSDADYRISIQRKILFNLSCGEPNTLITYFNLISGSDILYREVRPATADIIIYSLPNPIALIGETQGIKPVGVQLGVKYVLDTPFVFADEDGHTQSGGGFLESGYPESHGYTAGKLSEQITVY